MGKKNTKYVPDLELRRENTPRVETTCYICGGVALVSANYGGPKPMCKYCRQGK